MLEGDGEVLKEVLDCSRAVAVVSASSADGHVFEVGGCPVVPPAKCFNHQRDEVDASSGAVVTMGAKLCLNQARISQNHCGSHLDGPPTRFDPLPPTNLPPTNKTQIERMAQLSGYCDALTTLWLHSQRVRFPLVTYPCALGQGTLLSLSGWLGL